MKAGFVIAIAAALSLALSAALTHRLRQQNARLRVEVSRLTAARLKQQERATERIALRREARRAAAGDPAAARRLSERLDAARAEVAELERQALAQHGALLAEQCARDTALNLNRDLTRGPVLTQHCVNAGLGTPVDALQTIIWAALQGDDAVLLQGVTVSGATRATLQAALERQPAELRAKYATPEKLAALYVADVASRHGALEVVEQRSVDADHTVLQVRLLNGRNVELPMVHSAAGWQLQFAAPSVAKELTAQLFGGR